MLTGFAIQSPQGAQQTNAFTQSFSRPGSANAAAANAEQPAQFSPTPAAFNSGSPVRFQIQLCKNQNIDKLNLGLHNLFLNQLQMSTL